MGSEVVHVRAVVHGRVQMVGFRAFVIRHAGDAGLSGTVRNEPDGTVETVLEGPVPTWSGCSTCSARARRTRVSNASMSSTPHRPARFPP
jgi:acylphosphatase